MRRLLVVLAACGPGPRQDHEPTADAPQAGDGTTVTPPASRVYAHSGNTLYRIDTQTLAPVQIGAMTGLGAQSLTDLAIDKSDRMLGITLDKLVSVDATTGTTTPISTLAVNGFTSLSFVPSDLNDPNSADILVSANDQGDVFSLDAMTGTATKIGSYGTVAAGAVVSSGDLIGIRGLGIYATVDVGTQANDYLARIDPVTWKATPLGAGTGFDHIFGLGYWDGTIYGFVSIGAGAGKIITIDPSSGAGTEVLPGTIRWYGAGVATDAPILQ
jgi:hypothetical protein